MNGKKKTCDYVAIEKWMVMKKEEWVKVCCDW
jgi:hypothetical protein